MSSAAIGRTLSSLPILRCNADSDGLVRDATILGNLSGGFIASPLKVLDPVVPSWRIPPAFGRAVRDHRGSLRRWPPAAI
jgi:hypothetical protein